MEQIARLALSNDPVETVLRNTADAPIIFAYWDQLYDSLPELVAIAFSKIVDLDRSSKPYVTGDRHHGLYIRLGWLISS